MAKRTGSNALGFDPAFKLAYECVEHDYLFIMSVNVSDRTVTCSLGACIGEKDCTGMDYDEFFSFLIKKNIIPTDVAIPKDDFGLDRVCEELINTPRYTVRLSGEGEGGEPRVFELVFRFADETQAEVFVTYQNVSERILEDKLQNRRLTAALRDAIRANDAKTEFLSRMSHDMRTPLNGVIGMTELAMNEDDPARVRDYLNDVALSGKFLLGLINDVLDMARIEKGKLTLNPEPYELAEFISCIKAMTAPLFQTKHQRFILGGDKYNATIVVDKLRLNQIFFNLLSNASKYTPEGGIIRFSVSHANTGWEEFSGRVDLHFEIEDTGVGISSSFLKYIFEPFTREETGATARTQGTGLGLPIVRSLVDAMHGRITIDSELGHGTLVKVTLVLPLAQNGNPAAGAAKLKDISYANEPIIMTGAEKSISYAMFEGKRILLAEDNRTNAKLMQFILKKRGFIPELAENGREALMMFMESEPHYYAAILMDVRMPVMDGISSTRSIRALTRPDAQEIPIIAVTANAFDKDIEECIEAGMNAHLGKPVDANKLVMLLFMYCQAHAEA